MDLSASCLQAGIWFNKKLYPNEKYVIVSWVVYFADSA